MLRFLSSMKLAIYLIAALASISILATFFPQANAFQSWSFRLLVAAFFVNLALCTVKLLPGLWKRLTRKAEQMPEPTDGTEYHVEEASLADWLKAHHFAVSRHEAGDRVKILATKGKIGQCAPYVLHIAILVILIGALMSTWQTSGYVMGQEGQLRNFPENLRATFGDDSKLEVLSFTTEYDEKGDVDNWVTRFNLYLHGNLVEENAETRVNQPYRGHGLIIYQNSYQYQHLVEVEGSANEADNTTYGVPDGLGVHLAEQTVVVGNLNGRFYIQLMGDNGAVLDGGFVEAFDMMPLGETGATVTYLGSISYTSLELKTRQGTGVVFAGFILAVISSFMFLFGRYQEVQIWYNRQNQTAIIRPWSKYAPVKEQLEEDLKELNK